MWDLETIKRMNDTEKRAGVRYAVMVDGREEFSSDTRALAYEYALTNSSGRTFKIEEVRS